MGPGRRRRPGHPHDRRTAPRAPNLEQQLTAVELHADLLLALRLAQETLAERARTIMCQARLAGEGMIVADAALLADVQRELRAVKAQSAAVARLAY